MRFLIFLALNFGALFLGALLMIEGPLGKWYQSLEKAPWTPPGWVFGAAWTTIMICYSFYMSILWKSNESARKQILILFFIQWILNVAWNPVFFYFHWMGAGMLLIFLLELVLIIKQKKFAGRNILPFVLILPYMVWLVIAFSLNAYAWLYA